MLCIALVIAAGPALAGEAPPPISPPADDATAQQSPTIPCQCRFNGRAFELGESACLETPQGPRLARCEMAQNNTSWTFTAEACVISWHQDRPRVAVAAARCVLPMW